MESNEEPAPRLLKALAKLMTPQLTEPFPIKITQINSKQTNHLTERKFLPTLKPTTPTPQLPLPIKINKMILDYT